MFAKFAVSVSVLLIHTIVIIGQSHQMHLNKIFIGTHVCITKKRNFSVFWAMARNDQLT